MASDQIEICGNCKYYAKCKALANKKKFKQCIYSNKNKH